MPADSVLVWVCAWCTSPSIGDDGNVVVTHGMCPCCAEQFESDSDFAVAGDLDAVLSQSRP